MAGLSTVDGSEMLRGDVGSRAGAAFLLTAKAPITREWRRKDGWAVEIREGSSLQECGFIGASGE